MARISDVNKRRKLRYGQAVLLGVQFGSMKLVHDRRWRYLLPHTEGWFGYYKTRYEAVDMALQELGVGY